MFLVGYGSWPGLGEVAVQCLLCALAARSSNGVSLASSVASAVAAVRAITRYRSARRRLSLAIRPWPTVWVVFGDPDRDLDPVADAEFGLDAGEVCLHS
jgi:hypothetical protein